jgi:hypothetical protein
VAPNFAAAKNAYLGSGRSAGVNWNYPSSRLAQELGSKTLADRFRASAIADVQRGISGMSGLASGISGFASAAAVPVAIGAVGGPILDMLFPAPANRSEQDELLRFREGYKNFRYGPATPQRPRGTAHFSQSILNSIASASRDQAPASRGQVSTAGAGPNGPNPNAIVQGQDGIGEEYRQRMNAYNNQAILARQSLEGYDPSKGPLPGAAQEAQDQGMDIWRGLNASTKMVQPGGAVGTFNPLMQGRGDVPSMEELWKGMGGGAPTSGPGDEAIKAAMAKGQYNAPAGSPNPFGQPANSVPAPPQQQGNAISGAFAPAQAEAAKYTAGATGMPNLPTTPEAQQRTPSTDFLDSKVGGLMKNVGFGMLINKLYGF